MHRLKTLQGSRIKKLQKYEGTETYWERSGEFKKKERKHCLEEAEETSDAMQFILMIHLSNCINASTVTQIAMQKLNQVQPQITNE